MTIKSNFVPLTLGRLISDLGSVIFRFSLSLYVLDVTGSPSMFSIILGFSILPVVIVNIFAGVFIDKYNKKIIMVSSDIIAGSLVLLFAAFFSVSSYSILMLTIYTIVISTIQAVFDLAVNASIPEMVSEGNVEKANSALQSVGALVNIVGPIIAAILYKNVGIKALIVIDGFSFLAAAICEMFLVFNSLHSKVINNNSYVEDIKQVYMYINEQGFIKCLLKVAVLLNFIYIPLILVALPYIIYNIFKVSELQFSLIQAAWFTGIIIGAIVVSAGHKANLYLKNLLNLFYLQSILTILWLFPYALPSSQENQWTVTIGFALLVFLAGALNMMQSVPLFSYLQVYVPDYLRARFIGVLNTAVQISIPLGILFYGFILERVSWTNVITFSVLIFTILTLYFSKNKHYKQFIKKLE